MATDASILVHVLRNVIKLMKWKEFREPVGKHVDAVLTEAGFFSTPSQSTVHSVAIVFLARI